MPEDSVATTSLASCSTSSSTRPPSPMRGVTVRMTPASRYSTDCVPMTDVVFVADLGDLAAKVSDHCAALPQRLTALLAASVPPAPPLPADTALERAILKQLIEINTSDSAGLSGVAARAMADRLAAAGFPPADVRVLGFDPRYQNLVARYRGRGAGKKPILLMAHLDVVDARREDWSTDPYTLVERDGFYYGRGTNDNKAGAAMLVANFIRYRREGFVPDRDLVIVLTADEETSGRSIQWLLEEHRGLVDAEFALNTDGGGGDYRDGKPIRFNVQAAEKVYQSFLLEVRNPGGHSSRPVPDNAIYRLSEALVRLSRDRFPVQLNEVTRGFFERGAAAELPAVAADMRPGGAPASGRGSANSASSMSLTKICAIPARPGMPIPPPPPGYPRPHRITTRCSGPPVSPPGCSPATPTTPCPSWPAPR